MSTEGLDNRQAYIYNVVMSEVLGTFEQAVLLALIRLGKDAYGRAILKEVQGRLERDVAAGAVHATLERLEHKGLLASRLGSGTPVRAGRARRYYRLLPSGVRALNDARAAVDNIWSGLKWPVCSQNRILSKSPCLCSPRKPSLQGNPRRF